MGNHHTHLVYCHGKYYSTKVGAYSVKPTKKCASKVLNLSKYNHMIVSEIVEDNDPAIPIIRIRLIGLLSNKPHEVDVYVTKKGNWVLPECVHPAELRRFPIL
jgi:hypothetical protein